MSQGSDKHTSRWPAALMSRIEQAADRAFRTGQIVVIEGYAVVPDVVLAEATANHLPTPKTWQLVRRDGRSAFLYQFPDEAA